MTMTTTEPKKNSELVESSQQVHLNFSDRSTDTSLSNAASASENLNTMTEETQAIEQGTALVSDALAEELFMEMSEEVPRDVAPKAQEALDMGAGAVSRLDFKVESSVAVETLESLTDTPVTAVPEKVSPLSLPAALCDDQLLKELSAIPNKMGFKIGEVAEMLGIKQYVLRYWETEFDVLKPKKAANNQRYYTKKDVENVFLIRKLLHRDRFSIEGARSALKDLKTVVKKEKDWSQVTQKVDLMQEKLNTLIGDLRNLKQAFL